MKNYVNNLYNLAPIIILFVSLPLMLSSKRDTVSYENYYLEQVRINNQLTAELEDREAQLCALQTEYKIESKKRKKAGSASYASKGLIRLDSDQNYPHRFRWRHKTGDYFWIHPDIIEVLNSYKGPNVEINSLHRPSSGRSQHAKGKAIDIRWDDSGKAMANWLITEEGSAWIEQHNITVYFEKIPEREYRSGAFKKFVLDNPHATGAHIHIGIN
jgi:uncharacterized protein YcbK (DUF882 family)